MDQQSGHPLLKTIIVSRPGMSQEALRTGLNLFKWVDIVGSASNGLSALALLDRWQPTLLVVDSNLLDDEILLLIQHVKRANPAMRCLVLTQTYHQQQAALQSGADAALSRNSSAQELGQALEQFLPSSPA